MKKFDRPVIRFEDAPVAITMEDVNKSINGAITNLMKVEIPKLFDSSIKGVTDQISQVTEALKGLSPNKDGAPNSGGGNGGGDRSALPPEVQAQLLELKRNNEKLASQLASLQEANKAAETKAEAAERDSAIRKAMSAYKFTSDQAAEAAYRLIAMDVKRNENGELVAGDNLPIEAYVKDALTTKHDYFLAGKEVGGAGASKGTNRSQSNVGLETIKPGMSAEERAAVEAQIRNAWSQAQQS